MRLRGIRSQFEDMLIAGDRFLEKLQSLNLPPSPRCNDEEFIRRAFIDTIGTLPTAQETRDFLADESASAQTNTRDKLIESLLKRPEFVDYWTCKWSDLLLVQSKRLKPAAMWSYYNWVRNNVAANTPWDKMVRQLVTGRGSTLENGAANFFILHEDPRLPISYSYEASADPCGPVEPALGLPLPASDIPDSGSRGWDWKQPTSTPSAIVRASAGSSMPTT